MSNYSSRLQHRLAAEWDGSRWTHPQLEQEPDISRGELRLAAEVAIAELTAVHVPTWVHERAFETLKAMARA